MSVKVEIDILDIIKQGYNIEFKGSDRNDVSVIISSRRTMRFEAYRVPFEEFDNSTAGYIINRLLTAIKK
ncbi:MAG TPA: hypothetical protein VL943_15365 [Niabella sp.]|nr:hypothetical protein [Niabella sp.]